jgi:HemY protein
MKTALVIVVLLVVGLLVGPLWSGNTGYVLLSIGQWTVETSVVAALILLVISILILRVIFAFIARLVRGTKWGMRWFGERRQQKAETAFHEALVALNDGDYAGSSRAANRAWQLRKQPNDALLAAYAAQHIGDLKQAREWLTHSGKTADLAVSEMLYALRDNPESISSRLTDLKALLRDYPRHPELIRAAIMGYQRLHRYDDLVALLPIARELKLFSDTQYEAIEEETYYALMLAAGRQGATKLQDYWQGLRRDERRDAVIRRAYLRALVTFDQTKAADKVAARALKRGELDIADLLQNNLLVAGPELRDIVQDGLKKKPDDPFLLQAIGQMALTTKDYALAQRALRRASELAPSQRVWLDLAVTYDALGDTANALQCYREAMRA